MDKNFVIPLADSRATLEVVGGKGASLARLAAAGFPVPDGFHVTTEAYRKFVDENNLQGGIETALEKVDVFSPVSLEEASQMIRKMFMSACIPDGLVKAISEAYDQLSRVLEPMALGKGTQNTCKNDGSPLASGFVAVRSSATAEDLPEASFAGQQETFLNVYGAGQVLDAVKKCWSSLWTARAIGYRARQTNSLGNVALAVVIQTLVPATAAGIAFTANPVNGRRDEILINASWGLGEAVVGGAVTPDTIIFSKATGNVIHRETAKKQVMTVRTALGTQEQAVPDDQRCEPVLNNEQVLELAGVCEQIETLYGFPVDIEWALDGKFAILQARPVTALPEEQVDLPNDWLLPNPKAMYARGSLAEHLPNAVSPLFGTLGLRAINNATSELGVMMDMDLLEAEYQYRVINGYVYMGFILSAKFTWAMIKVSVINLKFMLSQGTERWLEARQSFAKVVDRWEVKDVGHMSPSEILDGVRELMYAAGKYYTVIQSGTLPTASSSEVIFSRIYRLVSRKEEPKPETLLFGLDTVSQRANKSLFDLGMWLRERPAIGEFMLHAPTDELVEALKADSAPNPVPTQDWEEFKSRFKKHQDNFGRTVYDFDFMNSTPVETPSTQLDAIKVYMEEKGSDPYVRQLEAEEQREQTVVNIQSRFKVIPNRWFNKSLKWAMDAGPAREDSIADMGMAHTIVRRMLGELGSRFSAQGVIKDSEDIYWLLEDEVDNLAVMLEQSKKMLDHSSRVLERKAIWRAQMKLVAPAMLPVKSRWAKVIPWNRENESGNVIKGLGVSAGTVTAPACVMFGPEDFDRMNPGDVLVAVTTTPAWTPLFAMASAVVTDIGGPLSHSSIVAREYGIPAVMATGLATRRIQDGQIVTVDGGSGSIILAS